MKEEFLDLFHWGTSAEDQEEEEKEIIYEELSMIYRSCPKYDIKIVMRDMNAKLGKEDEFRPTIKKHGLYDGTNDNGQSLLLFAAEHNMIVSSTVFSHKKIHKITWRSPDGETWNQIDHVLIDSRHSSDIQDVTTYRGATCDSDHFLVIAKLIAKILNARKIQGKWKKKFDCEKLKNEAIERSFQSSLRGE
ncbi:craniofacial development protein 2-like [Stegodyphus dumicola]|uniref:craniofacial development protein 2-like n=1 Tax=Stegodyphus dumicola TaxID=202533 RepID=UPI0015AD3975|nr:craniofacial development protein 2-like [Stegodyphus dumicola]